MTLQLRSPSPEEWRAQVRAERRSADPVLDAETAGPLGAWLDSP